MWSRGDLVRTVTGDGVRLEGFWQEPAGGADEAVIFVHGLSGNFYVDFTDALAHRLLEAGYAFLRTNNRGHDMGNLTLVQADGTWKISKLGSPWDHFPDALRDIQAWIDFAESRGFTRVTLLGHSLGTVKVTFYLGTTDDVRVRALVLASPADMIGMHSARHTPQQLASFAEEASRLVAAGRGNELMPAPCGIGLMGHPLSAGEYLEKFGSAPSWDLFDFFSRGSSDAWQHLSRVKVPVYAYFGDVAETVPGDQIGRVLGAIKAHAVNSPSVTTRVFPGANHWYVGFEDGTATAVVQWLNQTRGRTGGDRNGSL